ncbi:VOC family protein [Actinomycetospora sp. NBRC 106378]|uniref:VOC family protein n=1 Tax=Actinomycetospora sp. NBRC 106378 TaxID=3032208 RepID=UPI0024A4E67F|nr:VOC family protein [Actinomycetospora sp. NBRC 106378]GLZ54907.1 VOC family protein [Actinomycetospora sp. NBRC 106378]
MGIHLNPYLHFGDSARAAMEFYRDVLGGTLNVMTFGDMGAEGPEATQVMHAQLETEQGIVLMASDTPPGMDRPTGSGISVSLSGDQRDALRGYFERLAADGTVSVPLEKQMWGDEFGQCTDRFGVTWLVNIAQPQG